ncbi:hypothetical protein ABBQ38_009674 [Trebouxia sp. C0009 RCD-2024]
MVLATADPFLSSPLKVRYMLPEKPRELLNGLLAYLCQVLLEGDHAASHQRCDTQVLTAPATTEPYASSQEDTATRGGSLLWRGLLLVTLWDAHPQAMSQVVHH